MEQRGRAAALFRYMLYEGRTASAAGSGGIRKTVDAEGEAGLMQTEEQTVLGCAPLEETPLLQKPLPLQLIFSRVLSEAGCRPLDQVLGHLLHGLSLIHISEPTRP